MKIRTDFVTNSSSSSFVAVNIESPTLQRFLEENDLDGFFEEMSEGLMESMECLGAELATSPALSLSAMVEAYEGKYGEDDSPLVVFLRENRAAIDAEAKGSITVKDAAGEDGFAYYQKLEVANGHGKLTQWPFAKGWSEEGYSAIQEYNREYGPVFETIWDDEALEAAVEQDGVVKEFDVPKSTDLPKQTAQKAVRLQDIDPVNTDWIADMLFVFTGLSDNNESIAAGIVEENGGVVKGSVGLKTNYVIYNPDYDHETTKLKKAKELIETGKPIQLLTVQEFCEKLTTGQPGAAPRKQVEKAASLPTTMKECKRVFDCYESGGRLVIRNVLKPVKELVIPGEIEGLPVEIQQGAFDRNKKLEKVVFSEGVVEIGPDSFKDCVKLKEVVFADSVKEIGCSAFTGTPWRDQQGDYVIVNDTLVAYRGKGPEAVIPDGVKRISAYACSLIWGLKSVVVPDSVEYIGESAFSSSNLTNIQLPDHEIEFGKNPFNMSAWSNAHADWIIIRETLLGASSAYLMTLEDGDTVVIPDGVRVIGEDVFNSEFNDWSQIRTIRLPEGLEVIGDKAFRGFSGVEAVELPSTVTRIGSEAFSKCKALRKINFPEGLKSIGKQAFSDWEGSAPVEEIILPDSVEDIGDSAFAGCKQLRKLRLPRKLERIPNALVCNCIELEQVEMPEKCRTIGKSAFEGCKSLEAIALPDGLESIALRTFHGCERLKALDLPNTLRELDWATFGKCAALTSMAIPEGVKKLPEELFNKCANLQKVHVPKSVKTIHKSAFNQCLQLTIECFAGSSAEKFALKAGIPYTLV